MLRCKVVLPSMTNGRYPMVSRVLRAPIRVSGRVRSALCGRDSETGELMWLAIYAPGTVLSGRESGELFVKGGSPVTGYVARR